MFENLKYQGHSILTRMANRLIEPESYRIFKEVPTALIYPDNAAGSAPMLALVIAADSQDLLLARICQHELSDATPYLSELLVVPRAFGDAIDIYRSAHTALRAIERRGLFVNDDVLLDSIVSWHEESDLCRWGDITFFEVKSINPLTTESIGSYSNPFFSLNRLLSEFKSEDGAALLSTREFITKTVGGTQHESKID